MFRARHSGLFNFVRCCWDLLWLSGYLLMVIDPFVRSSRANLWRRFSQKLGKWCRGIKMSCKWDFSPARRGCELETSAIDSSRRLPAFMLDRRKNVCGVMAILVHFCVFEKTCRMVCYQIRSWKDWKLKRVLKSTEKRISVKQFRDTQAAQLFPKLVRSIWEAIWTTAGLVSHRDLVTQLDTNASAISQVWSRSQ